jgi:hypothetical protein
MKETLRYSSAQHWGRVLPIILSSTNFPQRRSRSGRHRLILAIFGQNELDK